MESENDILQMEKRIRSRVKRQMEKNQREYYLNEQMKAIQKELGDLEEAPNEIEDLSRRIERAGMPKEVKSKALSELNKLKLMSPMSAEATVVRNYVDTLLSVPWKKRTKIRLDLKEAEDVLEADHYGLDKVKERILEYLAVQQRVRKLKGPILCLVGPPGWVRPRWDSPSPAPPTASFPVCRWAVCVTRRRSVATAAHTLALCRARSCRTYPESEPGIPCSCWTRLTRWRWISEVIRLLRLLEVLDPEQNHTFADHYLEVDFDLSEVMFVATANTLNIPPALLDRMEVIRLSGYTEDEKVNIAVRYLVPKQMENNGLKDNELEIGKARFAKSFATIPERPE